MIQITLEELLYYQCILKRVGDIAQWLRAFVTIVAGLGSVLNIHTEAHNHL